MWLKFAVISKGRFSHLKVEQMKVEVDKIWIKSKIVITFFSKKKNIGIFKRKDSQQSCKSRSKRLFFSSVFYISCSFEGFLQTALTKRKKDVSMSI